MNDTVMLHISLAELAEAVQLPETVVLEVIEQGILEPLSGNTATDWRFASEMISVLKKAHRLHLDLEINWQGIAMVLQLLEQREQLLAENARLRQMLGRFMEN